MAKKEKEETALAVVKPETTEIATQRGLDKLAYEPGDAAQAFQMAKWICASGLYDTFRKPEAAFMVMAKGKELGMSALQAIDGMHIISSKVTMAAQSMVALVKNSGAANYFKCVHTDAESATWETLRKDDPTGEAVRATFTIEQAKKRGYTNKKNWKEMPENMLRWRAASELARLEYPEIIMGLYTSEEMIDHSRPQAGDFKALTETEERIIDEGPTSEVEHLTLPETKARIKERKAELGEKFCYFIVESEAVDAKDLHAILACLDAVRDDRLAVLSTFWALAKRLNWSDADASDDLRERFEVSDPTECTPEQLEEVMLSMRQSIKERE